MQNDQIQKIRHSLAHIMAHAVVSLWPKVKVGMGPAIENGFYYDFDLEHKFDPSDLKKIEDKMQELLKQDIKFEHQDVSKDEAKKIFNNQPYKIELIESLPDQTVSIYKSADFSDLCKGPHIESTKEINKKAFKLDRIAGAYWKGNAENKQLQRIYGLAFETPEELKHYLARRLDQEKRDHRKIGEEMDLFTISEEVGPGLILWMPKGNIIKEELEKWAKETEKKWGYQRVTTPHITKSKLYYTSGHLPYYKDDMYPPMKLKDGGEYYLKPMNCPHHHMIFKARPRSYKELPLRMAEYGTCYRYESSGELFGLMRVRGLEMNDAHIYCTQDQAINEFVEVMKLHEHYYKLLGIRGYYLTLSLRDPNNKKKYHGDEKMWELAEKLMREAVTKTKLKMVEDIGGAAFYGPKIDFVIHSSIGREFAISTNQIDLFMGQKFDLKYNDQNNKAQTPIIIHRAPLGSHERFIGFLIEHFAGNFPVWLSPVQVLILSVSEKFGDKANELSKKFEEQGIRVEVDNNEESVGKKIASSRKKRAPYTIVFGEREEKSAELPVRMRDGKVESIALTDFITKVKREIEQREL